VRGVAFGSFLQIDGRAQYIGQQVRCTLALETAACRSASRKALHRTPIYRRALSTACPAACSGLMYGHRPPGSSRVSKNPGHYDR